jgi:protein-S-isoprenylcysteine O-methyltransferase Ste14
MTAAIVLVAMLLLFSLVHTGLAHDAVRVRLQRLLQLDARRFRFAYNLVSALLLAGAFLASRGDFPILWRSSGWVRVLLYGIQAAALVGLVAALRTFDLRAFAGLRHAEPAVPTTTGVFRICRHPLYLFTCVFFSAWPTMDLRMLIVAVWLWLYAWIGSIFEERKLIARFGDAYRDYQRRHARLLPLPRLPLARTRANR